MNTLFNGRMNRKNFLLLQSAILLIAVLFLIYTFRNGFSSQTLLQEIDSLGLLIILLLPVQFIGCFRRLHDINQSGVWSLLLLVPYVDMPFFIYISYKQGDVGENQYGIPDTRSFTDSVFNTPTY